MEDADAVVVAMSLPGAVSLLHSAAGCPPLHVLEQRLDGRTFRWLCSSRPGVTLAVESVLGVVASEKPDGGVSSSFRTCKPVFDRMTLLPEYHRTMAAALSLVPPPPRHLLFLGLGGGVLPCHLCQSCPRCVMTCVEADARVLHVAQRYFGCTRGPRLRLHSLEAHAYLRRFPRSRFDAIFLDCSCASSIDGCGEVVAPPAALRTVAALQLLRSRLRASGGALVVNCSGNAAHRDQLRRNLSAAFGSPPRVVGTDEGNDVFVGLRGEPAGL